MAIISSAASTLTLSSLTTKPTCSTYKTPNLSSSNSLFFNKKRALVPIRASKAISNDRKGLSCNCLFGLGVPELVVIAGVAALVFGPKKLPEVGRSIGKTVKSFQQAAKEFETELKKEPDALADPPAEKAREVSQEEKQDAVSNTNES